MAKSDAVADHYTHGRLLDAILAGVTALGKTPQTLDIGDLAPVDEFHIGGRQATEDFVAQLGLSPEDHVLDVGCGIGGTARYLASTCGCRVTGLDLTPEFVEAGRVLCAWVGLGERVDLTQGSALAMPFEPARFDAVVMLHVGMNIADKAGLFAEVGRVLRPGATFGLYDIMRRNDEPLVYPVPWAAVPDTSALATPEDYRAVLAEAGFEVTKERDRREFAAEFFAALRERTEAAGGPPPLGLHILLGETAALKVRNMVDNVAAGRVSPVEMIARKRP
jgi:ubiquinone/menaquinone biosynthesis C-methylase UbiE